MATTYGNAGDLVLGWKPNALVELWRQARARDLLLPKLIFGTLDVSKLDADIAAD